MFDTSYWPWIFVTEESFPYYVTDYDTYDYKGALDCTSVLYGGYWTGCASSPEITFEDNDCHVETDAIQ